MGKRAEVHQDLEVYQRAVDLAMRIFELSKSFPKAETYSLEFIGIKDSDRIDRINKMKSTPVNLVNPVYSR